MNPRTLRVEDSAAEAVLYMATGLSNRRWKLVLGDGRKPRQVRIEAGNNGVRLTFRAVGFHRGEFSAGS